MRIKTNTKIGKKMRKIKKRTPLVFALILILLFNSSRTQSVRPNRAAQDSAVFPSCEEKDFCNDKQRGTIPTKQGLDDDRECLVNTFENNS